jgi:hypothetical protein
MVRHNDAAIRGFGLNTVLRAHTCVIRSVEVRQYRLEAAVRD